MLIVVDLAAGCGKVGAPIPPEDTGVPLKIEEEQRQQAQGGGERPSKGEKTEPTTEDVRTEVEKERAAGESVVLPPLRPVGSQ